MPNSSGKPIESVGLRASLVVATMMTVVASDDVGSRSCDTVNSRRVSSSLHRFWISLWAVRSNRCIRFAFVGPSSGRKSPDIAAIVAAHARRVIAVGSLNVSSRAISVTSSGSPLASASARCGYRWNTVTLIASVSRVRFLRRYRKIKQKMCDRSTTESERSRRDTG